MFKILPDHRTIALRVAPYLLAAATGYACDADPDPGNTAECSIESDVSAVADTFATDTTDGDDSALPGDTDAVAGDMDGAETDTDMASWNDSEGADVTADTGVPSMSDADINPGLDASPMDDIEPAAAIRCADLNCTEQGRTCVESEDRTDDRCGGCLVGFIEDGDACVALSCTDAADCMLEPAVGEWSACGGYADTCAREGTQTRMIYGGDCVGGRCAVTGAAETRPCPELRNTDGESCLFETIMGECESGVCVESVLDLGSICTADSQCPVGAWCSTVSGFRRCSPRLFPGEPHQMDFVYVPSGAFSQGTPESVAAGLDDEGSGGWEHERPYTAILSHSVFVSQTELTQGQWRAASDDVNPACFQEASEPGFPCSMSNANDQGPVESVDWYSALAYANWLSTLHGLQPCYTLFGCDDDDWYDGHHSTCSIAVFAGLECDGYRLLTESEWERAARGGTETTYYWGDAIDPAIVQEYAWFIDNSNNQTQAVGQKLPNSYGLYDMSGNVREWVWDTVYGNGGWIPYPTGSAVDYLGGTDGYSRGMRGGSFDRGAAVLRTARRGSNSPASRWYNTGMRLARTVRQIGEGAE